MITLKFDQLSADEQAFIIDEAIALAMETWSGYSVAKDWAARLDREYGFFSPEVYFEFDPYGIQSEASFSCKAVDSKKLLQKAGLYNQSPDICIEYEDDKFNVLRAESNQTLLVLSVLDSVVASIKLGILKDLQADYSKAIAKATVLTKLNQKTFLRKADLSSIFGDVTII